jgi:hypothetical protein
MKNHSSKRAFLAITLACGFALMCGSHPVLAEEGGSGHYFPGSMSSFVDAVSPVPAFIIRYNQIYFGGSAGKGVSIPIGGTTALGLHAQSWGEGITLFWRPPIKMSKHWSYAMSATIPFLSMKVSASAVVPLPSLGQSIAVSRTGTRSNLGDLVVMPLMLNYNVSANLNVNFRLGFYLPTGDYGTGRLANTGKNFYTTEPTIAVVYLGAKNGREASLYTGVDFNSENNATHYQSGTQFHLDGTLAQHLPLLGGLAGVGLTAFYYQQVSGDSGSGATLGSFQATDVGLGPVGSYVRKLGKVDFIAELKWLHEVYTKNRLQGDTAFLKIVFKF